MTNYLRTLRLFRREVRLNLITQASFGFCYFGVYAVLLNIYLLRLGCSLEFISLVNAIGALAFAISSASAGLTGERWGNQRMMFIGTSMSLVGFVLLPLANLKATALQNGWIVATFALAWSGIAQFVVNCSPFLMAATGPEERGHVFAMTAAVIPLAAFAGNLVGGILPSLFAQFLGASMDQPGPYRYPLLVSAVLLLPGVLLVLATRDVDARQQQEAMAEAGNASPKASLKAPLGLIAFLALVILLQRTGEGTARTFFNIYLDTELSAPTALIGSLSAVGQLLAVLASLATPLLTTRWGVRRVIFFGGIGMGLSLLPMAFIPHWSAVGIGFISVTSLVSIVIPAFTVFNQEIVAPKWRTAISGAATMAIGLSWTGMALLGGQVIATLGYRTLFLIGIGLTIIGTLIFGLRFRVLRGAFIEISTE